MPEPLATIEEVASYLRLPPRTLYGWRYKREGPPSFRVGRHVRYRWEDVQRWLADRKGGGGG